MGFSFTPAHPSAVQAAAVEKFFLSTADAQNYRTCGESVEEKKMWLGGGVVEWWGGEEAISGQLSVISEEATAYGSPSG